MDFREQVRLIFILHMFLNLLLFTTLAKKLIFLGAGGFPGAGAEGSETLDLLFYNTKYFF